jgi:hypothetical protein
MIEYKSDIFGQPLPNSDRAILTKPHYRRKQVAGFVPLWNEFFRCYRHAGVSPQAAYLWAYLRQYEHERREWNAVSDISWPGRRDIAEALGVSINYVPTLLAELRQAGLVSFQPVLPGFEDLARTTNTTLEAVKERAAELGVNPKNDSTLYRTADPFTKTEFATATKLKFCKECKLYRHCEAAKQARTQNLEPAQISTKEVAKLNSPENLIPLKKRLKTGDSPERQPLIQAKDSHRLTQESLTDSIVIQPATLPRVKTIINKPNLKNQTLPPTTNQMVVDNISPEASGTKAQLSQPAIRALQKFGFDLQTASNLALKISHFGKPDGYLEQILNYCRRNASRNPLGMARRLIENGEERLDRQARWKQQNLFSLNEIGDISPKGEPTDDTPPLAELPPFPAKQSNYAQLEKTLHEPTAAKNKRSTADRSPKGKTAASPPDFPALMGQQINQSPTPQPIFTTFIQETADISREWDLPLTALAFVGEPEQNRSKIEIGTATPNQTGPENSLNAKVKAVLAHPSENVPPQKKQTECTNRLLSALNAPVPRISEELAENDISPENWWQSIILKVAEKGMQTASEILRPTTAGLQGRQLTINFPHNHQYRRATEYRQQLEYALLHATGQLYQLNFRKGNLQPH